MSMSRLVEIIGPAPSELSIDALIRKLAAERDRVRDSLIYFREQQLSERAAPGLRRTAAKEERDLVKLAKATGLTIEQIKQLKQIKGGT